MGGIIARSIYITGMLGKSDSKIQSIISVGSPFLGADLARLAAIFGVSKETVDDMSPNSSFLRGLKEDCDQLETLRPETYCITSPQDWVVQPYSAEFQCECLFNYPQWGHIELVKPRNRSDERYKIKHRSGR
jgi:hypothetical protein